jgi:phosphoribosylaminoimidazole-succinocarboxamide synthase
MEAREAGNLEPDIPPLPADVAKQVGELYVGLFERLTGEKFR